MKDSIYKIFFFFPHNFHKSYGFLLLLMSIVGKTYAQTETDTHNLKIKDEVPCDSIRMETMPLMPDEHYNGGLAPNIQSLSLCSPLTNKELKINIPHDNFNTLIDDALQEMRDMRKDHFWKGRYTTLYGLSSTTRFKNMMENRSASFILNYKKDNIIIEGGFEANQYETNRITNQFGITGSITYTFTPHLSMTLFGSYYNTTPFATLAMHPYISSSTYGGYMTYKGEKGGLKLGARRYYDPFLRRWETEPILTPTIHFSNKSKMEIPLGGLLKTILEKAFIKGSKNNSPNIMPPLQP